MPVTIKISCEVNEGTMEEAFAKIEKRALKCARRVKKTLAGVPGAESINIMVPMKGKKIQ